MKLKTLFVTLTLLLSVGGLVLIGQENVDFRGTLIGKDRPVVAVPDFRATGDAQKYMDTFNTTLWEDLDSSGVLKLAGKGFYPLEIPQQPNDFQPKPAGIGASLKDWSGPPVGANNLVFGYAGVTGGQIQLLGWLYNLSQATPATAQVFQSRYVGDLSEAGARKIAHDFAADILKQFGVKSLAGSRIVFVSDRTGSKKLADGTLLSNKEIWSMDYDGSNQRQLTRYGSTTKDPAVSPDGKMLAYITLPVSIRDGHSFAGTWQIKLQSLESGRQQVYANYKSSVLETPEFTPDGQQLLFSTTIDKDPQICTSNLQGGDFHRISHVAAIEVSPRVNPKNPNQILFISGRSGHQQLWMMNANGGDQEMLTNGEGDVANPAWRDDGQFIAFVWTRGFERGQFNVFVMNMRDRSLVQLTHGNASVNENPWWAPDGLHIVFASTPPGGRAQIHIMLADGTHVSPPLTTQGNNTQPVWVKAIN
jgi:TolB protein